MGRAFSGKDSNKVDRSGAYAARWASKNIVAAGLARRCEIRLAYAIGVVEPVSVDVETFGTGTLLDEEIAKSVQEAFDFRPQTIIESLGLRDPIFKATAVSWHFGRSFRESLLGTGKKVALFPWETLNRREDLRTAAKL